MTRRATAVASLSLFFLTAPVTGATLGVAVFLCAAALSSVVVGLLVGGL